MASKANLIIDQGTDWQTSVVINTEYGDPFDFTNYTAVSQIRKHYSSVNSISVSVTLSLGSVNLSLSANTTANTTPGRYLYDVDIINTSTNNVTRIIEGIATITGSVTKL